MQDQTSLNVILMKQLSAGTLNICIKIAQQHAIVMQVCFNIPVLFLTNILVLDTEECYYESNALYLM